MPNRLSSPFKPRTIQLIQLLAVLGIAVFGVAVYLLKADYLFTGTITAHQQWFPNLYLITYLATTVFLPVLIGIWLSLYIAWLPINSHKPVIAIAFTISTIAALYLIKYTGFSKIILFTCMPAIVHGIALSYTYILKSLSAIGGALSTKHYVSGCIFFVCYIIACLVSKDIFHPFYKYRMYQNINDTQLVFTLVDNQHNLIPINQYYKLSENGIFNLHTRHVASTHTELTSKEAGKQLWLTMQQFKKKPLPYDSVSIIMTGYFVNNNRLDSVTNVIFNGKPE